MSPKKTSTSRSTAQQLVDDLRTMKGVKIHISQLVALPEAGANIAIFDARWLSETSVQLQWNSRIVMMDDYATLPGQAR